MKDRNANQGVLIVTPANVHEHPWLLSYFNEANESKKCFWKAKETYHFQNISFQFSMPIFKRERKAGKTGFAFEMFDSKLPLGSGAFGCVYPIRRTISTDRDNHYRIRDKQRVVKRQNFLDAHREYRYAKLAPHLHAKAPSNGYMAMRRMKGKTVYDYIHGTKLTRSEKLDLTLAIAKAVRSQLADLNLSHTDLHAHNMFVEVDQSSGHKIFTINIIDYGLAVLSKSLSATSYSYDFALALDSISRTIWLKERNLPKGLANLSRSKQGLTKKIELLENCLLAPTTEAQTALFNFTNYCNRLMKTDKQRATLYWDAMLNATRHSSINDMSAMMHVVKDCHQHWQTLGKDAPDFPMMAFFTDTNQQIAINTLSQQLDALQHKANKLKNMGLKDDALQLSTTVKLLRDSTAAACCHADENERQIMLKDCHQLCVTSLNANKAILNTHTDCAYIFAEIGIVLASLVVLYPIVAGIHYLVTKHFGIFSQTYTSKVANEMLDTFQPLLRGG